jgi:hypothetical protein
MAGALSFSPILKIGPYPTPGTPLDQRPVSSGHRASTLGYSAEPLVSYQINRQLSGWNLPPLVIRAFGAHCQYAT